MKPPATLEANLILDHARKYLESQPISTVRKFPISYAAWFIGIDDALALIKKAQADVNKPEPRLIVVLVDAEEYQAEFKRITFKVLVASVEDENVQAMLPFQTAVEIGSTFRHIRNESFYSVCTNNHVIEQGVTLCARGGHPEGLAVTSVPTCPGCLIKAKNIIVAHLLERFNGDYVRVAKMLADKQ